MSSNTVHDPSTLSGRDIGARLCAERLRLKLSQQEMAERLGLSHKSAVKNYEKGQIPRPRILTKYARVLGRSVQWILTGNDGASGSEGAVYIKGDVKLSKRDRAIEAIVGDLLDSKDTEIIDHLRRQLRLLQELKDRRAR